MKKRDWWFNISDEVHIISKVDSFGNEGDTIAEEIYGLKHTVNDLEWLYIRAMAFRERPSFF